MLHAVPLKILVFIVVVIVSAGCLCWHAVPKAGDEKFELLELLESMNNEHSNFNRQRAIMSLCADAVDPSTCIRRLEVR